MIRSKLQTVLLSSAILASVSLCAALAAPVIELGSDRSPSTFTSVTAAVPAVDTSVVLTSPARHIVIKTDTGAAALHVRFDAGTATTSNFKIDGGGSLSLDGLPLINSINIIGASASGNYSVLAW